MYILYLQPDDIPVDSEAHYLLIADDTIAIYVPR